ncbi:MAG: DUF4236 domain-containing protein [Verrucomicrobiota bacterium]|jgi:hypothetical protein
MGFTYRKSVRVGPFRVNLSTRGVGWSVGAGGFRTGVSARGRRYSTFTLPGTGLGYRTSHRGGCMGMALVGMAGTGGLAWMTWTLLRG